MIERIDSFDEWDEDSPEDPPYCLNAKIGDVVVLYGAIMAADRGWEAAVWADTNDVWCDTFDTEIVWPEVEVGQIAEGVPTLTRESAAPAIAALESNFRAILRQIGQLAEEV